MHDKCILLLTLKHFLILPQRKDMLNKMLHKLNIIQSHWYYTVNKWLYGMNKMATSSAMIIAFRVPIRT